MRVIVIGATGHVGTYLVPLLVEAGHEVTAVSRGSREPYAPHAAWRQVRTVAIDRTAADQDGSFGRKIAALDPDVVIDMICFTPRSLGLLVEALRGRVGHLLVTGSIWIHGPSTRVPLREEDALDPFGEYGINKLAMARLLEAETRRGGLAATTIHPGHIVGPGRAPLNPEGHFDPEAFRRISQGEEIHLPNLGMETVHHVHAEDVARLFMAALENLERIRRRILPRRFRCSPEPARLCRSDVPLVRPRAQHPLPGLGGVEARTTPRSRRAPPGTTSPTARAAAWRRRAGSSASSPGGLPWLRSRRRWAGSRPGTTRP